MENKIYYIYHLPHFVHKDGMIGKIGVSKTPIRRTKMQGFNEYEILEQHTCIFCVSDREIELQKQYAYKVDTIPYWKSVLKWATKQGQIKGGKNSSTKSWKNNRERELEKCSKGGQINAEKTSKITIMCDLDGNEIMVFKNRKEAANYVNGFGPPLKAVIDNPNKTYKGYKWKNG